VRKIRLQLDLGGTSGEEAWDGLRHFSEISAAICDPVTCGGTPCQHPPQHPHPSGEWREAFILVEDFVAEYALPHYLRQPRVMDAVIEPLEE